MNDPSRTAPHAADAPPGREPVPEAVSAAEAVDRVARAGAASVIDLRAGVELAQEYVPGARWIPLDRLEARLDEVEAVPAPRLLLCRTGARAERARRQLAARGVADVAVVEGGLEAYRRAGGATLAGEGPIALERQVRIAAGALVLLGVSLAAWVHPGFLGLAAFVGLGLVFAGVTDWCGMGLLLARAPWNRRFERTAPASGPGASTAASDRAGAGSRA